MAKRREIYYCTKCGITMEALTDGGVQTCCGTEMELLKENTKEAAVEKHLPVIEAIEGGYRVTVGSVRHPMEEAHYIQWIELIEGNKSQICFLNPGDSPVAEFRTDAKEVSAREHCNLHGLWKA